MSWTGRAAGSPKRAAGRSPPSTTSSARSTSAAPIVWRSRRCAASSTSGWRPPAPTAPCAFAADALDAWAGERDAALQALRDRDRGELVDALLEEGDAGAAWTAATAPPAWDPGLARRTRLAEARERTRPDEALAWYLQVVDEHLLQTGRPAYARAVSTLKRARRAAQADAFATALTDLRERHRRRPALIAMLDNAALG